MAGKIASFVAHEIREMAPPTLFFLIVLNLLVVTVAVLSDDHVVSAISFGSASLGALLVGKSFLIAMHLPILEKHAARPFFVSVGWYTAIYFLIATVLHLLERLISAATGSRGFLFTTREDISAFDLPLFVVIQLWLIFFIAIYALAQVAWRRLGTGSVSENLLPTEAAT